MQYNDKPLSEKVAEGAQKISKQQLDDIAAQIAESRKIEAIKIYRGACGCDLKTAKEYIDALEQELHQQFPEVYPKPMNSGCLLLISCILIPAFLL